MIPVLLAPRPVGTAVPVVLVIVLAPSLIVGISVIATTALLRFTRQKEQLYSSCETRHEQQYERLANLRHV